MSRIKRRGVLLAAGMAAAAAWPAQAGLIVSFNTATSVSDHFNATGGQLLPDWNATNGVASSGGIDVLALDFANKQGVQKTGTTESFTATGAKLAVSSMFRIDQAPTNNPSDARLLDLYLTESDMTNLTGTGAGNAHTGVRLNTTGNNTTYRLTTRNNNANGSHLNSGTTFGLDLGVWHKMTVTFENAGAGVINLSVDIDEYDAAGTTFVGNVVNDFTASATNTVLTSDSNVWAGFRIPRGDNLSGMDDFTFVNVPEPASLALLGAGGLMLVRRRRV